MLQEWVTWGPKLSATELCTGRHGLGLIGAVLDSRVLKGKFHLGKRQAAKSSPLVSQSWKEVAPGCLVGRPPPQGKQEVRPASGWNVPRAQGWQGVKPSVEYSPGWHRPGGGRTLGEQGPRRAPAPPLCKWDQRDVVRPVRRDDLGSHLSKQKPCPALRVTPTKWYVGA